MREIIIGDIHGCNAALNKLLAKLQPDPRADKLIFLGDLFDRLNAGGMLGIFFLVTAVMMWMVQRLSGGRHISRSGEVGAKHAVTMGCFQVLGMMTGISRSGSTTLGGICSGLSRKTAIKFC